MAFMSDITVLVYEFEMMNLCVKSLKDWFCLFVCRIEGFDCDGNLRLIGEDNLK